jgi:hypothetical protein
LSHSSRLIFEIFCQKLFTLQRVNNIWWKL